MTAIKGDLVRVAGVLYSDKFISSDLMDKMSETASRLLCTEHAAALVNALKARVIVDQDPAIVLNQVCNCLERVDQPALTTVINNIRKSLGDSLIYTLMLIMNITVVMFICRVSLVPRPLPL